MAKPEENQERRRFEDKDRKPWSNEEREQYEKMRSKLAPIIRDLTTPPPAPKQEKKKDFLEELFA
jgi:hypothetical protein